MVDMSLIYIGGVYYWVCTFKGTVTNIGCVIHKTFENKLKQTSMLDSTSIQVVIVSTKVSTF